MSIFFRLVIDLLLLLLLLYLYGFNDIHYITIGPWVITMDMPSYLPAMQHLKSREIREKLYKAYVTRASEHSAVEKDNAPLIKRILQIKQELSHILG